MAGDGWGLGDQKPEQIPPKQWERDDRETPHQLPLRMVCLVSWPSNGSVGTVLASKVGGCWAQALEGRQHQPPPCREQTQVSLSPASVLCPHLRSGLAHSWGGSLTPAKSQWPPWRVHLGSWSGLHREAWGGGGHCAQLALQLAGMAGGGGGLRLQSEGLSALRPWPRWERSALPRLLHPDPPCLTPTGLQGTQVGGVHFPGLP